MKKKKEMNFYPPPGVSDNQSTCCLFAYGFLPKSSAEMSAVGSIKAPGLLCMLVLQVEPTNFKEPSSLDVQTRQN